MEKSTKNIIIIGSILAALGVGAYFFLKKKNEHTTESNNNILPADVMPNQWTVGNSNVRLNESINGDTVTVTYYVSGGNNGDDNLTSFTPPVKSPYALHTDRYTNGVKTGECYIDGDFAYVKGSGDGILTWTYKISL